MISELDELNSYVKNFGDKYNVIFQCGGYILMNDDFEFDMPLIHSENPQDIKDFFDGDDVEDD